MLTVTIAAIVVTILFIAYMKARQKGTSSMNPSAARDVIGKPDTVIVDVRSVEEYRTGHIEGALHIPLHELQGRMAELDIHKGKQIIVYCRSGVRSAAACRILVAGGFANACNLDGGCLAWTTHGFPLVK